MRIRRTPGDPEVGHPSGPLVTIQTQMVLRSRLVPQTERTPSAHTGGDRAVKPVVSETQTIATQSGAQKYSECFRENCCARNFIENVVPKHIWVTL